MSMKRLYRKVAKLHGVSANEVKKEVETAIRAAYQNPESTESHKAWQQCVPAAAPVPTADEFIAYAVLQANKKQN